MAFFNVDYTFTGGSDGYTYFTDDSKSEGTAGHNLIQNALYATVSGRSNFIKGVFWDYGSWETLFGVSAGSTVTTVQLTNFASRAYSFAAIDVFEIGNISFRNTNSVTTFTEYFSIGAVRNPTGIEESYVITSDGSPTAVPASYQASSTNFYVCIPVYIDTANNSSALGGVYIDDISLEIGAPLQIYHTVSINNNSAISPSFGKDLFISAAINTDSSISPHLATVILWSAWSDIREFSTSDTSGGFTRLMAAAINNLSAMPNDWAYLVGLTREMIASIDNIGDILAEEFDRYRGYVTSLDSVSDLTASFTTETSYLELGSVFANSAAINVMLMALRNNGGASIDSESSVDASTHCTRGMQTSVESRGAAQASTIIDRGLASDVSSQGESIVQLSTVRPINTKLDSTFGFNAALNRYKILAAKLDTTSDVEARAEIIKDMVAILASDSSIAADILSMKALPSLKACDIAFALSKVDLGIDGSPADIDLLGSLYDLAVKGDPKF
jgi:hypothetical protein